MNKKPGKGWLKHADFIIIDLLVMQVSFLFELAAALISLGRRVSVGAPAAWNARGRSARLDRRHRVRCPSAYTVSRGILKIVS